MQIALVLSDKMSLSVIRLFSEYSLGISNFVLKILLMVDSASFGSSFSLLVSHISLSFFIIKYPVWVSPTHSPRTKIFIDNTFDGSGFKLSGGFSNGRSVAVQRISGLPSSHVSLLTRRLAGCFTPPFRQSQRYASIPVPSGLYFPFFLSRFAPSLRPVPVRSSLLAGSVRCPY